MNWTPDRRKELALLQDLLNDASGVNRGNGIIERLQRLENRANQLNRGNISTPRSSFMQFLIELAGEDTQT